MKLHTFTQLGILTATSALAFIGGIITADLYKASHPANADPRPAAVEAGLQSELTRTQAALASLRGDLAVAQELAAAEARRAADTQTSLDLLAESASKLKADRDLWSQTAEQNRTIAEQNFEAAKSWEQATQTLQANAQQTAAAAPPAPVTTQAQPTHPVGPVPVSPHLLTPLHRALHEQPVNEPRRRSAFTHIIDTGYGTATVINPDGTRSYVQSTGEGTATVITPGR